VKHTKHWFLPLLFALSLCVVGVLLFSACERKGASASKSPVKASPAPTLPDILSGTPEPPPPQP
jgi:hypothetical protein